MTVRYKGRAVINPFAPTAVGQCDRCNAVYNRSALQPQMQYSGYSIIDTGLRVCDSCLDPLDPQQLPYRPRFDPQPVRDPRPIKFGDAYVNNRTVYPATGWARFRGLRPSLTNVMTPIDTGVGLLSYTGPTPSVSVSVPVGIGVLSWTGFAPIVSITVTPGVGVLTWTGLAPTTAIRVATGTGAMSWTGPAPSYSNVGGYVGFAPLGQFALGETP